MSRPKNFSLARFLTLVLLLGLAVSPVFAQTVTTNKLSVAAGQASADSITITVGSLAANSAVEVRPPTGWSNMTNAAGAGNTTTSTGGITLTYVTGTPSYVTFNNGATTSVTISYASAVAATTLGKANFTVNVTPNGGTKARVGATTSWVIVTADGAGTVAAEADYSGLVSGKSGETIQFNYTAPGTGSEANVLDGGTVEIVVPSGMPTPVPGSNIAVKVDSNNANLATAKATTEWTTNGGTVGIKVDNMDAGDVLNILYTPSALPVVTENTNYVFKFRAGAVNSQALDLVAGNTLTVTVISAARGGGVVTVSGLDPVPASSTGNEVSFTYQAEGTMDGGRIELTPPAGWTAPQGVPGVAGYTVVQVASGQSYNTVVESVNFDASVTDDGFSGNGIGIKIKQLRLGEKLTIVYGSSGGTSGAVAQSTAGPNNEFSMKAGPGVLADADIVDLFPQGLVNVSAGDGSGSIAIATNPTTVTAGTSTTVTITHTVAGPIYNGGQFTVAIPGNWPAPVKDTNISLHADSQGTFDTAYVSGRDFVVPVRSMTASGKIIKVEYTAIAPLVSEKSQFIFRSKGASAGTLSIIVNTAPDPDINYFEVEVKKAAAGGGKVGLLASQNNATAGATGKAYTVVYEAAGQMDGGKIKLVSPAGWTKLIQTVDAVTTKHISYSPSGSASLTNEVFGDASNSDTVTYDITTMRSGDRVTFSYTGVAVEKTIDAAANFQVLVSSGDAADTFAAVTTDLDGVDDGDTADVTEGATYVLPSAISTVAVADGSGTLALAEANQTTAALETETYSFTYTALAAMSNGSIELTVPADWSAPTTTGGAAGEVAVNVGTLAIPVGSRTITVTGLSLAADATTVVTYANAVAPAVAGTYTFVAKARGLGDNAATADVDEGAGRSLQPVASQPTVTVGSVLAGNGIAYMANNLVEDKEGDNEDVDGNDIKGEVLSAKYNRNKRTINSGNTNQSIVLTFEAVGTTSGGQVEYTIPNTWTSPQNTNSTAAGYVSVATSSGVTVGTLEFPALRPQSVVVPVTTMVKGQTISLTYGVDDTNLSSVVANNEFLVKTRFDTTQLFKNGLGDASISNKLSDAGNKLKLDVESVDGKGSAQVVGQSVYRKGFGATSLTFRFTAASKVGSIKVDVPTSGAAPGWTAPALETDPVTDPVGESSASIGDVSVNGSSIIVQNLTLIAGQSVDVYYLRTSYKVGATDTAAAGKSTFTVSSSGSATGPAGGWTNTQNLEAGSPTLSVLSTDGLGKVSSGYLDTDQDTANEVVATAVTAGTSTTVSFRYNLVDASALSYEYVEGGQLQIVLPISGFTAPTALDGALDTDGEVAVSVLNALGVDGTTGTDITATLAEADRPTVSFPSGQILVTIPTLTADGATQANCQAVLVQYKTTVPNTKGDYNFLVRQKSGIDGSAQLLNKNRITQEGFYTTDAQVVVSTGYGTIGTGTTTTNLPATVAGGATEQTYTFTYTAKSDLDGDLAANKLTLTIPGGWTAPTTTADAAGQVTVSDPDTEGRTLTVAGNTVALVLGADLDSSGNDPVLTAGSSVTLTYAKATAPTAFLAEDATPYSFTLKSDNTGSTNLDADGDGTGAEDATEGKFDIRTGAAVAGTGALTVAAAGDASAAGGVVTAKATSTDNDITFTLTAAGKMDGQQVQLVVPNGWSAPSGGATTGAGYISHTGTLSYPAISGNSVYYNIITLTGGNAISIVYSNGVAQATAVAAPAADATDTRPKFVIQTRLTSADSWTDVGSVPVTVINALAGTGSATISPDTAGAGQKQDYTVTYTTAGTLDAGGVGVALPAGWSIAADEDGAAHSAKNIVVTTTGVLAETDNPITYAATTTVALKTMAPGQTVTFVLKGVTAPTTTGESNFVVQSDNGGVDSLANLATLPKVTVGSAAAGSGSVAKTAGVNIINSAGDPGTITLRFTAAGQMTKDSVVSVEVPSAWTAPVADTDGDNAGEVTAAASGGADITLAVANGAATVTIGDTALAASGTIDFNFFRTTAPASPGIYPFVVKSGGAAVTNSPINISVSKTGPGSGTLALDPATARANAADTAITFTYTAAETLTNGQVQVSLPSSWTAPDDDGEGLNLAAVAGVSMANIDVSGQTIVVNVASLAAGGTVQFRWTGTVQKAAGSVTLTAQSKLTTDGALGNVSSPPTFTVENVAAGTGSITVVGITEVSASSTGNQLVFDYKATGSLGGGELKMIVPSGWTAPQATTLGTAGYVTAASTGGSVGTLTVSGQDVVIPVTSLQADQTVRVRYGSGSGSSGAQAQGITGYANFEFSTKGKTGDGGDEFASVGRGTIYVKNALDGSGSLAVAPSSVAAGSSQELTLTFTASGAMSAGKVEVSLPAGWPAFSTTAGAGYSTVSVDSTSSPTASVGIASVVSGALQVPVNTLGNGESFAIKYGSGGGDNGVVIPSQTGSYSFSAKSQSSSSGSLVALSATASVTVASAADGSGTATVASVPASINAGSSGNTVTVTYTAVGPINAGAVAVVVPTGWTAPLAANTTVASNGTVGALTFDAQTATVGGVTLAATQTVTFTLGDMDAQASAGSVDFAVQSKGSAEGALTAAATATLTIGNAADGSGTVVVSPAAVIAGSTNEITITYTSIGTIAAGGVQVTIPAGWSEPQTSSSAGEGFVTSTATGDTDSISVSTVQGSVVTVPVTQLAAGSSVVVTYKNAIAPTQVGSQVVAVTSKGSLNGSYVALAAGATLSTSAAASTVAFKSDAQSPLQNVSSDAIVLEARDADGNPAPTSSVVAVTLASSSATGVFSSAKDGAGITEVTIDAGASTATVYYKDSAAGAATLTATSTALGSATQSITVTDVATQIAVTGAEGYVGDAVAVTIQTLDANGKAASTAAGVTVTVATDSGTLSATSVTLQPNETSTTVTLTSSAVGSASITASATGLTSGSGTVTANNTISSLVVSGSPVNAGSTVTVTAIGKPAASATFSISGDVATAVAMTEEAGTYTGSYTATSAVADGSYDVTVTIGAGSDSSAGSVVIDNTAPAITSASSDKTSLRNGESLTLTVVADAGATVSADVSALDTTQATAVAVAESTETAGTYSADVAVSSDTAAESGDKVIVVTATDVAGNSSTSNVTVSLTTFSAFDLVVPKGIGLIHVPLSVTEVNGEKKVLTSIGDLYDAIGDDKAFLITYDTEAGSWRSYLGANNKGSASDVAITDDLGIITVRTAATDSVTVSLKGNALGNGTSSITLKKGKNLVGVPVKDSRTTTVGELLSLEGVSATSAIVSDQGAFKVLTALDKGQDSDIAITGGQSFIIIGKDDATVAVSGDAWDNASAVATAPAMSAIGFEVLNQTPVLAIEGSLNSNGLPIETDQFRVSLKNVTTGAIHSGTISDSQFKLTVVDAVSAKVASVGDVLEVSVETGNNQYGVESQRHTVSQTDVSTSLLRLPELVTYEIPAETALLANYPNPFNPETWVPFRLAADSNVQLTIYDASGSMVRQIDIGFKSAAVYESRDRAIYWDGRNASGEIVASGVYFYTLEAGDYVSTRKMLILK